MEKLISNNEYNEIEISKYGKKKFHTNKVYQKFESIYTLFLLVIAVFLIIFFFIYHFSSKKILFEKETNPKIQNQNIKNIISEKDKLNEIALKTKLIPYPMVQYFLQRTNYALVNIFKLAKIKKEDIDINKLLNALNITIYNHPVLLSRFHKNEKGEIFMEYRPDLPPKIEIINIKDKDIPNLKDNLLHQFEPFDSQLVNFTIYVSETSIYFYYDIFHSNFDGNSLIIFEKNLELAYLDKPLPKDYYYLNLYQYNKDMTSKQYNDTVKFYQDNFNLSREYCPKFDKDIPDEIKNNKTLQLIYKEYS